MRYLIRLMIFLLGLGLSYGMSAEDKKIELKQALELNRELDGISLDIIRIDNLSMLEDVAQDLKKIRQQATLCVTQTERELAEIEGQLAELTSLGSELTPELSYLKEKQQSVKQVLSQCRLADLRVRDLDTAVSEQIEKKFFTQLFRYNDPLWKNFLKGFDELTKLKKTINSKTFLNMIDYRVINPLLWKIASLLMLLGLIVGLGIKIRLTEQYPTSKNRDFFNHLLQCGRNFIIRNAYLLIPLILITIFYSVLSMVYQQWLTINLLSFGLLVYALFAMLTRVMFYPGRPLKAILRIPKSIGKSIYWILQTIAWILIVDYALYFAFPAENMAEDLLKITNSVFVISVTVLLFVLCIRVMKIPYLQIHYRWLTVTVGSTVGIGLIMVLLMEMVGLHHFAQHILIGLLSTLGLTLLAWNVYQFIEAGLGIFADEDLAVNRKVRQWFGARRQRQLLEVFTLKLALNILLWGSLLIALFNIWGLPETDYKKISDTIFSGFTIGKLPIYPMRIVWSLILFSGLMLLTRFLSARYLKIKKSQINTGAYQAVATIFSYIGFTIALLMGLLVSGVNFTGLAIIAGALSVGIGLGLQNIANNFISGVILLLEQPIKVGDRVLVGDIEGFVKKISIRATQIATLDKSDIIVPNSQLVSEQVTNLMFRDFHIRVYVSVGVAYGSDTALVRKVLLDVAYQHPHVVTDDESCQPYVLFERFGDNSLEFKLYCIIRDVNKKYTIPSELHFQIDQAFREHQISIAFPQRDLHIRDWPIRGITGDSDES